MKTWRARPSSVWCRIAAARVTRAFLLRSDRNAPAPFSGPAGAVRVAVTSRLAWPHSLRPYRISTRRRFTAALEKLIGRELNPAMRLTRWETVGALTLLLFAVV